MEEYINSYNTGLIHIAIYHIKHEISYLISIYFLPVDALFHVIMQPLMTM